MPVGQVTPLARWEAKMVTEPQGTARTLVSSSRGEAPVLRTKADGESPRPSG